MIVSRNSSSPSKFHLRLFSAAKTRRALVVAMLVLSVLSLCLPALLVNARVAPASSVGPLENSERRGHSASTVAGTLDAEGDGVSLQAVSGRTIVFKTRNGRTINASSPQTKELPQLVLYRNGILTAPEERTVTLKVSGIQVPPSGVRVTVKIETQHPDPDWGRGSRTRIPVWQASQWIANTSGITQTAVTASFTHTFDKLVLYQSDPVPTPTDYFRYEVFVTKNGHPLTDPLQAFSEDFAFLMQNQSLAQLPPLRESARGVAPNELLVHYADMFPFQKDAYDPNSRLPRTEVRDYVETELVPAMVAAIQVPINEWEFPWRQIGSSYRLGAGERQLSVALTQSGTWFHGRSPATAHSGIFINVESKDVAAYDNLTDGIMAYFHHELFHNLQRNLNLDAGWNGDVDGVHEEWAFITEGTAVMAASVARPQAEFGLAPEKRAYMSRANVFLAGDEFYTNDLNTSYRQIDPYRASIYWRFLYEQYSRQYGGLEDQAIGMQLIRQTLNSLYAVANPDGNSPADPIKHLPVIMDKTFANIPDGPFKSFGASLVHFARAIYALRLEDGRWDGSGTPQGTILYDPNEEYAQPPVTTIDYSGQRQNYSDGIANSFGMDFVDVLLDPSTDGQSLTIEFSASPDSAAKFNLQVWKLVDTGDHKPSRRIGGQISEPEVVTRIDAHGNLIYTIKEIDTGTYNRLGVIVTRIDPHEDLDSRGGYSIKLH